MYLCTAKVLEYNVFSEKSKQDFSYATVSCFSIQGYPGFYIKIHHFTALIFCNNFLAFFPVFNNMDKSLALTNE